MKPQAPLLLPLFLPNRDERHSSSCETFQRGVGPCRGSCELHQRFSAPCIKPTLHFGENRHIIPHAPTPSACRPIPHFLHRLLSSSSSSSTFALVPLLLPAHSLLLYDLFVIGTSLSSCRDLMYKMSSFTPLRVHAAVIVVVATVLLLFLTGTGRCVRPSPGDGVDRKGAPDQVAHQGGADDEMMTGMLATGSSLPDCSHACGPCSPCRRVMVSFECSVAESCPIVYRCMCRGKYYQVPSN